MHYPLFNIVAQSNLKRPGTFIRAAILGVGAFEVELTQELTAENIVLINRLFATLGGVNDKLKDMVAYEKKNIMKAIVAEFIQSGAEKDLIVENSMIKLFGSK